VVLSSQPPRFARSPHLVTLVGEVERLAAAVAAADADDRAAHRRLRRDEAVAATLGLDGAATEDLPDAAAAAATIAELGDEYVPHPEREHRGTWLDAMRVLEEPSDDQVRALEVLGVHAADDADDLVDGLLSDPAATLAMLHRRLTRGLVAADRAGQPRVSEQAVHDGRTGRVLYFTSEPHEVPGELNLLDAWMASTGAREHGLIASGVLHLEILRIHPFDAANGRLARAAARLVLRARGLDPDHLAVPEPSLAADPLGYAEEVARTRRRRDLTIWLERWGDAVVAGLRDSARGLGQLPAEVDAEAAAFIAAHPAFTVTEHRAERRLGPEEARTELGRWLDAGAIARVPGSSGLRFVATAAVPEEPAT
jgi:fido (protein-threonine AMPylation protein)